MVQRTVGTGPPTETNWRLLLATLPLATGAALVVYILAGWSLRGALAVTALCAALTAAYGWRRLGPLARIWARRRIVAGVAAGIVATAGYDLVRLALVHFGGFTFWPFDIFAVFGRAFLGPTADIAVLRATGVAYHFANGLGYGIAYSLIFGRRGPLVGLAWGMGLELFMVALYPGWLHIGALFGEFLSVSLLGHVTYGLLLGTITQRLLARGITDARS